MNKEEAKVRIDSIINHLEWSHGGGTDYVESDRDQAHQIIDQIEPDHPKVKLPREVGEELDEWMFDNKDRLVGNIGELIFDTMTHDPKLISVFDFVGDSEENYFKIIDAYRYGWEAEPEELFYVKAPENWNAAIGKEYRWVSMCDGEFNLTVKGQSQTFTRAQIKEYHLDSDIFTLVPVEVTDDEQ